MKALTPKKLILGAVVLVVAISIITMSNLSTVMLIFSSKYDDSGAGAAQTSVVPGSSSSGSTSSGSSSTSTSSTSTSSSTSTQSSSTSTQSSSTPSSSGGTQQSADKPGDPGSGNTPDKPQGEGDKGGEDAPSGELTTEQIVDLYVKAENKAKASAKNVILVKDGALNYNDIFEAGAFSSFAPMLKGFFKLEDLNAQSSPNELPPRDVDCNLNAANVQNATIKEENGIYTVEIILNDSENPTVGDGGVGSVVNIISLNQITDGVKDIPGISLDNIKLSYTQVKITATIEKDSGNLTYLIADAPSILSLDAKAGFLTINDARVGIQCISEFSVAY